MNVTKILEDLRRERTEIEAAIISLERLARERTGPRRGRPPAWLVSAEPPKKRGRPRGSKNKKPTLDPRSAASE